MLNSICSVRKRLPQTEANQSRRGMLAVLKVEQWWDRSYFWKCSTSQSPPQHHQPPVCSQIDRSAVAES